MSISDAIQRFLDYIQYEKRYSSHTWTSYKTDLLQFELFAQNEMSVAILEEINLITVRSWMASLKSEKEDSAKTIRRKISSLKSFFKYHIKEQNISSSPITTLVLPKINKRLPSFLTETETEKFSLQMQENEDKNDWKLRNQELIIAILYSTGMRLSELIHIQIKDIDFIAGQIKILGKGNKERIIPMGKTVLDEIKEYLSDRPESAQSETCLLVTESGKKLYPKYVYNIVHAYLSTVTTQKKKNPHLLRHTFATQLLNNGADLNAVKELLGHASLAATQVYTHNSIEKLKSVFKQAHPKA